MNNALLKLEHFCENLALNAPYTNTIGLARSVLAIGLLLTLLVNPMAFFLGKSSEGIYYNPLIDINVFPFNKFNFFLLAGVENASLMKVIAIIILIVVISGYFMKISSILHWWIAISFTLCSSIIDGGDQISAILTFLLIPVCLTDQRKNHWDISFHIQNNPVNIIAVLFIWLIRLQVAIIYFDAAVGKFKVSEWINGTAIYYWLNNSNFGVSDFWRPLLDPILSNGIWVSVITYGVLILELSLFLALTASHKYRKRIFPVAVIFHLFIIIFHGISSFFFSICAALILYLLPNSKNINLCLKK